MDSETRENFRKHVLDLQARAENGDMDASKSLACMALLAEGGGDDGDGEPMPANVVFLSAYRKAA